MSKTIFHLSLLLFLALVSHSVRVHAQAMSIDYILGAEIQRVEPVNVTSLPSYQVALPFGFDNAVVENPSLLRKLKTSSIFQIDLVYSSFRESKSFSQISLNRKRLELLKTQLPTLFDNTAIQWNLVEQVEDHDRAKAEALFHGFIFSFREYIGTFPSGKKIDMHGIAEKEVIMSWMGDTVSANYKSCLNIDLVNVEDTTYSLSYKIKRTEVSTNKYIPRLKFKRIKGKRYAKRSIWKRKEEFTLVIDTLSVDTVIKTNIFGKRFPSEFDYSTITWDPWTRMSFTDSVVSNTFNRHPEWDNVLVVTDVTGSMMPYVGQTLAWRKLHDKVNRINDFAFFNDGDNKPDGPIGKSGGVYSIHSNSSKEVETLVLATMAKGYGGGCPENDIEAMLKALDNLKHKPERIILIADNLAPVRDMVLFENLLHSKVPVDVILCGGSKFAINAQYLAICRNTAGTLHLIEDEITNLMSLAEGEVIEIGSRKWKVTGGEFVPSR